MSYETKKDDKVQVYSIVEDCASAGYRPIIHSKELWETTLPNAFTHYMKKHRKKNVKLSKHSEGGMVVPFEVRDDPEKGRGLYATADIPKGTQVWTSSHFHHFKREQDFLAFLQYLPHNVQCDVILWTYPEADSTTEVAIPFDEGVYMNDGGPGSSRNNVDSQTVALRDIKAGEELMQDYTEFIDLENEVKWFAKLRQRAFGNYAYTQQGAPPNLKKEENRPESHLFETLLHDSATVTGHMPNEADLAIWNVLFGLSILLIICFTKFKRGRGQGLSIFSSNKVHGY
ncbi:SET methyltransferase domain containing protein [Nitzschia inconspicua]|uniref:SET methyltransferase domain containing protein n=1 Tax=Nitzschia inconspicua TaxID=303405 RepID=A0A9K3PDX6_9STRA|nr:SET methyltransferase domain containing protein [Nitzschia inconspicua]